MFFKLCKAIRARTVGNGLSNPDGQRRPSLWHGAQPDGPLHGVRDFGANSFRWRLQPGWRKGLDGADEYRIDLWMLDPVTGAVPEALLIETGSGAPIRIDPHVARDDTLQAANVPAELRDRARICGFQTELRTTSGEIVLSIVANGAPHPLVKLTPRTMMVLQGARDWLFLTGDTNDSPGQFSRNFAPSSSWTSGWRRYLDAVQALRQDRPWLKSLSFVVAPSKETLFPDLYPLPPARNPLIDVFLAKFGNRPEVLWPAPDLAPHREYAFDKVETHWTDFGARLTCEAVLRSWQMPVPPLASRYRLEEGRGDLGDKLMPPIHAMRPVAQWDNASTLIFDNFALHHGSIRIWQNPKPAIDETLMIFGGSSSEYMIRYFSAVFARVVSVYTAGAPDPVLLDQERPDRVILQTSQRFLTRPPLPATDALDTARTKILKRELRLHTDHGEALRRWQGVAGAEAYLRQTPVAHPTANG